MKKTAIISIVISLFLISCEKDILQQSEPEDLAVVEAYLYAGESVDDIYLRALLPYGGNDTAFRVISDAEIRLSHNEETYRLEPADSAGFYEYKGNGLEIIEGEKYQIEIDYFGKTITAETTVPQAPTGLTISNTNIYINEDELQNNPREFIQNLPQIELEWNESADDYFYVLVENIETDAQDIDLGTMGERFANFKFVSRPVQLNTYTLMPMIIIKQYGTHLIRIFRVNKEYANLYESMEQDSRNLNEPLTNITNGLGIFTAFSCDSVYFEVVRQ